MIVARVIASARLKPLKLTLFASIPDPNLLETRMKQVSQVLQASLAFMKYAKKEPYDHQFFILSSALEKFWGSYLQEPISAD